MKFLTHYTEGFEVRLFAHVVMSRRLADGRSKLTKELPG